MVWVAGELRRRTCRAGVLQDQKGPDPLSAPPAPAAVAAKLLTADLVSTWTHTGQPIVIRYRFLILIFSMI